MSRSARATAPSTAWTSPTRDRFIFEEAVIVPSYDGPDGRARYVALNLLDGRLVAAVFSPLGTEALALIILRPANRRERRIYEDA